MILLTESKRDDLLLPYFELVKDKFPGLTLGKFKGLMLDKLAAQGGINNLSLGSNFYLAGATKYYFQGQLTTDGQASLLNGDATATDNWDVTACKKLNIVVKLLRDAYIDTVGTKFEVEEDFGNLSINKLFRKYGKKINAALGIENPEADKPEDTLDRNPRVGNGYTFDIIYSFQDATKYNQYTTPGAWCITYGEGHYRSYTSRYNGHFVIFLKDGYQDVERKCGPGFTSEKPQDEYGNSMIAYLQNNNNWRPSLITSRWNHGYGEVYAEADEAYSLDEFCRITGVTPEDLQRIYEIWKKDAPKTTERNPSEEKKEIKAAMGPVLRRLKYAQMMVNNGKGITEALSEADARPVIAFQGELGSNKNVSLYTISENQISFHFLKDRNSIIFDTLSESVSTGMDTAQRFWQLENGIGSDIIVIKFNTYYKLYSIRYHSFIDIGGVTKFKKVPNRRRSKTPTLMEIKNSFKDIALISLSNSKPIKLPNGDFWVNKIITSYNGWDRGNEITAHFWSTEDTPILELIYDESSGEQYFYSLPQKRFIEGLDRIANAENVTSYAYGARQNPEEYYLRLNTEMSPLPNYFSIMFTPDGTQYHTTKKTLLDRNGNVVSIYGVNKFAWLQGKDNRFILYKEERDTYYNDSKPQYAYDTKFKKLAAIGDKPVDCRYFSCVGRDYSEERGLHRFYEIGNTAYRYGDNCMLYDGNVGLFLKNPFTGDQYFKIDEGSEVDGSDTRIKKDEFDRWEYLQRLRDQGVNDPWAEVHVEEAKHYASLLSLDFEYYENALPENDEYPVEELPQGETQPATSLAEGKLNESKRDDLLLPYLEIAQKHGVNMSLGQFKTRMLTILGAQGGIHNLSLSSNYYLAGVTRYYFNGDLTINKDLAIFKNDENATDQWNEDVCKRLDALVLILRNAYIDTVGTQFELAEDFGTLSLPKLLRKYNKKINDALGIAPDKPKKNKEEEEEKVYDHHVGNGYTYEILYSFADGRKFERPTAPGSWCITYGEQYYNMYKRIHGIHYVVFMKDGYQNVERKVGPGFTREKPQDEYGNSLIAYLQYNNSWEAPIITSRWNHGWGNVSAEADSAYTISEFCQVTGVSPQDLQRIWQEWKENKNKMRKEREVDPEKAQLKEEKKDMLRRLKYAQMRLNGGELPENLFMLRKKVLGNDNPDGTANFKKGMFIASLKPSNDEERFFAHYKFVIDRGKILFDSLVNFVEASRYVGDAEPIEKYVGYSSNRDGPEPYIKNAVVILVDGGYLIYDTRKKDYITVDGTKKFKYVIGKWSYNRIDKSKEPLFYPVAMRSQQIAFIYCSNNEVLRLPNGEHWFSEYHCISERRRYRRGIDLQFVGKDSDGLIEIVYDSSSREKYFYSPKRKRFINTPDISDVNNRTQTDEITLAGLVEADGIYGLTWGSNPWAWHSPAALFNSNNERISLGGLTTVNRLSEVYGYDNETGDASNTGLYILEVNSDGRRQVEEQGYETEENENSNSVLNLVYDASINGFLAVDGNKIIPGGQNSASMGGKYFFYRTYNSFNNWGIYAYYIYDTEAHGLLINPCGYPSKYLFESCGYDYEEGVSITVYSQGPRAGGSYWNREDAKITYQLAALDMDMSTLQMAERKKRNQQNVDSANLSPDATSPALSLSEGEIRKMVSEAIRKITAHKL